IVLALFPIAAAAQAPTAPTSLTVDDAVQMALQNNVDLAAARLDPQIGDMRVAAAKGLFTPSFGSSAQRNNQLQPPAGLLTPTPTRTDVITTNVNLNQRLPWFGTSYSIGWDTSHTNSDSFLNSFNPLLRSGLSMSFSQPLFKDLFTDTARTN